MEKISELAAFLPQLEDPGFKAGEMIIDNATGAEIRQWPYAVYEPIVESLVDAAYRNNWVLTKFDWPTWGQSERARQLRDEDGAIEQATGEEVCQLLTILIRQDRFSEGSLLESFNSGLMLRIVRRAKALADREPISKTP
jgi:hypothetical protein